MSEWKECTIGDIGTVIGGATPFTTDSRNYDNGNIPWITPKDLSDYHERYISRGERNITEAGLKSCATQILSKNTVLFSSRAPIGYIAIASNEVCTNQGFKSVIPNKDVDYLFLYYLLKYNKETIEGMGSGTTFKEVSKKTMEQIKVRVPKDISVQRRIAGILDSLDSKIELNNQINRNLEEQAQAIFKSWFIDFEPFGGIKPEDWNEVCLKDCCSSITDGVHNTVIDDPDGDFYLLSCKNIKGGVLSIGSDERKINKETFDKLRKRTKLAKGDILLSSVGTVGEMLLLTKDPENIEFQRSVAIIKAERNLISPEFLYNSLIAQKDTIVNAAHGAVQQCIFLSDIGDFKTILPTSEYMNKYTLLVSPYYEQISKNQDENMHLISMRDTLLPKLMSGGMELSR